MGTIVIDLGLVWCEVSKYVCCKFKLFHLVFKGVCRSSKDGVSKLIRTC